MTESVGNFICGAQHEDLEIEDIDENGAHIDCGEEAIIWAYAPTSVKKEAKKRGIERQYEVYTDAPGNKSFKIRGWAGTYGPEDEEESSPHVHQVFHGDVQNVAGGDIHQDSVSVSVYLNALSSAIKESQDIPEGDKPSLLQRVKELSREFEIHKVPASLLLKYLKTELGLGDKS